MGATPHFVCPSITAGLKPPAHLLPAPQSLQRGAQGSISCFPPFHRCGNSATEGKDLSRVP